MASKEDENSGGKKDHETEAAIAEMKLRKSRAKAAFTRTRNKLHGLLADEDTSVEALRSLLENFESNHDVVIEIMGCMLEFFKDQKRTSEMMKTIEELDDINYLFDETMKLYHSFGTDSESNNSGKCEPSKTSKDMYKQMKRVSIRVFTGVKKDYEFWLSAFTACVDSTDASSEYKLLQLRQYLGGSVLKVIVV